MIEEKKVLVQDIEVYSEEYQNYYQLTEVPKKDQKLIGNGEAAAISLAYKNHGIVASNNLRDIDAYILVYELRHTTTSDILIDAYVHELISEKEGNIIWKSMLGKRRKLGDFSFTNYLYKEKKNRSSLVVV